VAKFALIAGLGVLNSFIKYFLSLLYYQLSLSLLYFHLHWPANLMEISDLKVLQDIWSKRTPTGIVFCGVKGFFGHL
jgi:hypothetical protein